MAEHLTERRLALILSVLKSRGECRTSQLAEQFNLSEMTLRRDFSALEKQGLLKRVHGGAVLNNTDVIYDQRLQNDQVKKQAIGTACLSLLKSGQIVYVDAGTTAVEVARAIKSGLAHVANLTIVTNGITVASELAGQIPYKVCLIGGDIYQNAFSTVGPIALAQIANLRFDLFLMGSIGVSAQKGWTNSNDVETLVKQAVMQRSKKTYVIADSSKWQIDSYSTIADFAQVDGWVVNRDLAPQAVEAAQQANIELVYAENF